MRIFFDLANSFLGKAATDRFFITALPVTKKRDECTHESLLVKGPYNVLPFIFNHVPRVCQFIPKQLLP